MPMYLVESYEPDGEPSAAAAVSSLLGSRSGARHRWSFLLPEEDLCLHVLDGPSAAVVHEATVRAALQYQRISEVVLISAEHVETQGGSP